MERQTTKRPARGALRILVPMALALTGIGMASAAVWSASNAAFTATTQNGVNSFSTGTIHLSDNDSNAVLFNVTSMNPGDTAARCIRIVYDGDITTSNVKLYASSGSATNSLDTYINITIERGSDSGTPTFGSCTNFTPAATIYATNTLFNFRTNQNSFVNGVDNWLPTANGQTRDYRFTYAFSNAAPNGLMGSTATVTFTWESQV